MSTQPTALKIPTWDLSDRLAKSLRAEHISVQEMAEYLGVSRNTIGNYVNGRTTPDKRTLMLWSLRCGVPVEWLVTGAADGQGGGPHIDGYSDGPHQLAS